MPMSQEVQEKIEALASDDKLGAILLYVNKQLEKGAVTAQEILDYAWETKGFSISRNPCRYFVVAADTINKLGVVVSKLKDQEQKVLAIQFYKLAFERGSNFGSKNYAKRLINGEGSVEELEKYVQSKPSIEESLLGKLIAKMRSIYEKKIKEISAKMTQKIDVKQTQDQKYSLYLKIANLYKSNNDFEQAVRVFEGAKKISWRSSIKTKIDFNLGVWSFNSSQYKSAIEYLRKESVTQRFSIAYYCQGEIYYSGENGIIADHKRAAIHYEIFLDKSSPDDYKKYRAKAAYNLGLMYIHGGRINILADEIQDYLEPSNDQAKKYLEIAKKYYNSSHGSEAKNFMANIFWWLYVANGCDDILFYDEEGELRSFLDESVNRGCLEAICEKYKEDAAALEQTIEDEGFDIYEVGKCLYDRKAFTLAEQYFNEGNSGDDLEGYFRIGLLEYEKDRSKAKINFQKFLDESSNNDISKIKAQIYIHWCDFHLDGNKVGNKGKVIEDCNKFLKNGFNFERDDESFSRVLYQLLAYAYLDNRNKKYLIECAKSVANLVRHKNYEFYDALEKNKKNIHCKLALVMLNVLAEKEPHLEQNLSKYSLGLEGAAKILKDLNDPVDFKFYYGLDLVLQKITSDYKQLGQALCNFQQKPGNMNLNPECCSTVRDYYVGLLEENYPLASGRLKLLTNQLITILVYRAKRHNWMDPACKHLRTLIANINPDMTEKGEKDYIRYINEEEERQGTYFGTELSDDSDSEEERNFPKQSSITIPINSLFFRFAKTAEIARLKDKLRDCVDKKQATISLEGRGSTKEFFKPKVRNPLAHKDTERIQQDIRTLNFFASAGELEDIGASIETKFLVAQYRGIAYSTIQWNQQERRAHRNLAEIDQPMFSAAAYEMADCSFQDPDRDKLNKIAQCMREELLKLRGDLNFFMPKYKYDSKADYIQEQYTKAYDRFMKNIWLKNKPEYIISDKNPFISTGDTPFHGLKYAYGIKPYKGHEEERLRPRWREDGRTERPYSGKIYVSLHPIMDYGPNGPLHVPSMNRKGQITIDNLIIQERESTFPALIAKDRVKYTHIAKYPSFKGEYKEIFLYKYGLDEKLYNLFFELFNLGEFPPHSKNRKVIKALLGEYLCAYYEVRLLDIAQELAEKEGAVLIYRDEYGNFSLKRPEDVIPRKKANEKGRDQLLLNKLRAERIQEATEAKKPVRRKLVILDESSDSSSDSSSSSESSSSPSSYTGSGSELSDSDSSGAPSAIRDNKAALFSGKRKEIDSSSNDVDNKNKAKKYKEAPTNVR